MMDHFKHQKIQTLRQFRKSQYLKKAILIIFSVSVISFIFSNSSLLPFLVQSFNAYFSTISTYSAERNYIFLLFNGILVFIVKNSGLIGKSAALEPDHDVQCIKKNGGHQFSEPALSETTALVAVEVVKEIEEEYERNDGLFIIEDLTGEHRQNELPVAPEVEDIGSLSTDELNKKCDEFIRKMKEVIKIEAKQLISV